LKVGRSEYCTQSNCTYEVESEGNGSVIPLHPILAHVPVAMWLGLLLTKDHDQKTQIWWLPLIFAEEESEDRQA